MTVVALVAAVLLAAGAVLSLAVATALGQRRRHGRPVTVVAAGLLFPLTWVVWYVRDEHPYRRLREP